MTKFWSISQIRDVVKEGKVVHLIDGICTAEEIDDDGEICDYEDTKPLYKAWSDEKRAITTAAGQEVSLGNVRVQHTMQIGGKVVDITFDDTAKQISVSVEPIDDKIWKMIKKGFFTGYSQGGDFTYRVCNVCGTDCGPAGEFKCTKCQKDVNVRYACRPKELSFVDAPCAPSATFRHIKADGSMQVIKFAKSSWEVIQKEKKTKRVAGEDLSSSAFAYVGDPSDTSTWKLPIKFSTEDKTKTHIRNALSRFGQTQGIPDGERSKVHARIVAAARRHGIAVGGKARGIMVVNKSLYHIGWVASILSDISSLRDSNRREAEYEDDERDAAIADELEEVLATMIGIGRNIYDEETSELAAVVEKAAANKGANMHELLKAARKGLQHHFTKAASHNESMAELYKELHEEQLATAETHKSILEDPDQKALHGFAKAMAAHSKALAAQYLKLHKAHAGYAVHTKAMSGAFPDEEATKTETTGEVAKTEPAAAVAKAAPIAIVPTPLATGKDTTEAGKPGEGEEVLDVQKALDGMAAKSLSESLLRIQGSPEVQKALDKAVSEMLMGRIGNKAQPTDVKVAGPALVPRTGDVIKSAPDGAVDVSMVPLELADMCSMEMGD